MLGLNGFALLILAALKPHFWWFFAESLCQEAEVDNAHADPDAADGDRRGTELGQKVDVNGGTQDRQDDVPNDGQFGALSAASDEVGNDAKVHGGEGQEGSEVDEGRREFQGDVQRQGGDGTHEDQIEDGRLGSRVEATEEPSGQDSVAA